MSKFIHYFTVFLLLAAAVCPLQSPAEAQTVRAQDNVTVERTIHFQRGAISAVVSGRIQRGTAHWFHVRAQAGQRMAIVLKTGSQTSFTVFARNAGILEDADGVREAVVELPETGDFLIEIGTDAAANYTLEVAIK
ncbi:MAG: hypothetical protein M3033_02825 [Acidobacteriota bacterium]|nr:hypothetical protein [Acidobacteriota bacterium]